MDSLVAGVIAAVAFVGFFALLGYLAYLWGKARGSADRSGFRRVESLEQELATTRLSALLSPVGESLSRVQGLLQVLDRERAAAHAALATQIAALSESQKELRAETSNLVKALRQPATRGRWGEIQLRRIVEIAGMIEHCDFDEQRVETAGDSKKRPDLQVRLPGGKRVVVDAKAPCEAYLEALEAKDEIARKARLKDHARQVRNHVESLGSKAYWEGLSGAPDFVVLFLPGEPFLSAAWEEDPGLVEHALSRRVMLATPTTLIALLMSVAYGWRQEKIAASAQAVSDQGSALVKRAGILVRHFDEVGRSLGQAVKAYNRAVGSLEGSVLRTARRLESLGVIAPEPVGDLRSIEREPRLVGTAFSGDED